jgi:arylsulfatase A-like enzyme
MRGVRRAVKSNGMKVLVIVVRGLNAGYLGCYGNAWVETPALDRLAAEGVVFDRHYADEPSTEGACRSWRSGRCPLPLTEEDGPAPTSPSVDLLTLLRDTGVATFLIVDDTRPGLAEFRHGWDYVSEVPAEAEEGSVLERAVDAVVSGLKKAGAGEHALIWFELATVLPPWELPDQYREAYFQEAEEEDEEEETEAEKEVTLTPLTDPQPGAVDPNDDTLFLRLQRSYAGGVSYLDAGLELLFDELRKRDLLDGLLVIVTTDHGQPLGEHGLVGVHRPWLHEELVHLPLIVRLPAAAEAGRRVPALTQPVDLMPTLLDAFGVPRPEVHGSSLLPLARGQVEEVRPYACAGQRQGDGVEWMLRTAGWSFLLPVHVPAGDAPRHSQLYVQPEDRWEVNNVRQHHLELAEHLEEVLRGYAAASQRPGRLEPPELRDVEAEPGEVETQGEQPGGVLPGAE